jgi:hypothetical protein
LPLARAADEGFEEVELMPNAHVAFSSWPMIERLTATASPGALRVPSGGALVKLNAPPPPMDTRAPTLAMRNVSLQGT